MMSDRTFNESRTATLTSQDYWESNWKGRGVYRGFKLFDDISKNLPKTAGLSFMEVGCAPGGILADFCVRLGYEANGVEYAVRSEEIEDFLRSEGAKVGKIHRADFLSWQPEQQYDIVASFGFIEHFQNADEVADRHFKMAKPGGHVVITMPNFARGQKALHWLFDRKNLRLHNTKIMNLSFFTRAAKRNSATLIEARYAGGHYEFWREDQPLSWLATRVLWRTDSLLKRIKSALPEGVNPFFSPYLFAVYRLNP